MSEVKTLVQNFKIAGLYLSDAQSFPFVMAVDKGEMFRRDVDLEMHYTARQVRRR